MVLYIMFLYFWIGTWKTKDSALNNSKHCLIAAYSNRTAS